MDVNLEELLANSVKRTTNQSPAAKAEQQKRYNTALNMATKALRRLHKSDYDNLYQQARVKVDAERGPLPD